MIDFVLLCKGRVSNGRCRKCSEQFPRDFVGGAVYAPQGTILLVPRAGSVALRCWRHPRMLGLSVASDFAWIRRRQQLTRNNYVNTFSRSRDVRPLPPRNYFPILFATCRNSSGTGSSAMCCYVGCKWQGVSYVTTVISQIVNLWTQALKGVPTLFVWQGQKRAFLQLHAVQPSFVTDYSTRKSL